MEELRPDVLADGIEDYNQNKGDNFVAAPGEVLDDRDRRPVEFRVDEELSSTNTDFGGKDPEL